MCLVLHNPHVDTNYGQNVWCRLSGRVSHNKYWDLREHGLAEGVSTRLLIYAGKLMRRGIPPRGSPFSL